MKRFLVFFLVLVLAAGFVAAQDLGLTAGLEFGLGNVGKAYGGDVEPYLMPMVIYETALLDDALDLYAELDYTIGLNEDVPMSLYFDLSLGYNLGLGDASTLTFILENEFDELYISPDSGLVGIFTPAVKFNQAFDFGDLYAQIGLPITYIKDFDTAVGLDFTVGWGSAFGLGLEAIIRNMIAPSDGAGYYELEATISYETDPIYFEVNLVFPKETADGITITPEFEYALGSLTLYAWIEFAGVGGDGGEVIVTPALGVKYSF